MKKGIEISFHVSASNQEKKTLFDFLREKGILYESKNAGNYNRKERIAYSFLEKFEDGFKGEHNEQTLEHLSKRGGLSFGEKAMGILKSKNCPRNIPDEIRKKIWFVIDSDLFKKFITEILKT